MSNASLRVAGIIPARYGSTRLPAKPLVSIQGKPLLQWVYERARGARCLSRLVIATDDERIAAVARGFGAEVLMTSDSHQTGTDRICEAARGIDAEIIINIQGDEPLITARMIESLAAAMRADPAIPMATLSYPLTEEQDSENPHIVKVVTDQQGFALYFSRAPIPYTGRCAASPRPAHYKHIGIYAYTRRFLFLYATLAPTPLAQTEQLEQLRALEHGFRVKVLASADDTHSVDTAADVLRVQQLLADVANSDNQQPGAAP